MPPLVERFAAEPLLAFASGALERAGMRAEDAGLVARTLVAADLRGVMTHGLVRLPVYVASLRQGKVHATAQPELLRDSTSVALVDGNNAMGQVVAAACMEIALAKAAVTGAGAVTARNSNHLGTCAYYAQLAADRGMIGLATTNASAAMAPWGAVQSLVGNNPVAIAAPVADGPPIVLDMALTMVARGRVRLAQMRGEAIPPGWGLDAAGSSTTDPAAALDGSLLPIGGYKGYGLAVMVDLLAGALAGAALSPELENMGFTAGDGDQVVQGPEPPGVGTGHFFLALDIRQFVPLDEFKRRAAGYATMLRAAKLAEGTAAVYLPGELEAHAEQDQLERGIAYEATVIEALTALADAEGIPLPRAHPEAA